MDTLNSLNYDIDFAVNPLLIIVAVLVVLIIIAARRGWGWTPLWVMLGLVGTVVVVGILTGLALIPDGVDIFTVLIGSIGVIIAMIYMIVTPKSR